MWTSETIFLVVATFLFGGFVKGAMGLGLPIVALAAMAPLIGVKLAMALMLAPCVVTNIWQALVGPALRSLVTRLWSFLLMAAAGVWFGVGLLAASSGRVLLIVLGIMLGLYSVLSLTRPQIPPPARERERYYSPVFGGLGGVMFGMVGTFLVPGILYLQALGLNRNEMVQALGLVFTMITVALTISFSGHNLITQELALMSVFAIAPTGVGLFIGTRYRHRISEQQFRTLFFISLFIVGIYMLIRGALS